MSLRAKFLIFFATSLFASLGTFVAISFLSYSQDKISLTKEQAIEGVHSLVEQISKRTQDIKSDGADPEVQILFEREDLGQKFLLDSKAQILASDTDFARKNFAESVSSEAIKRINSNQLSNGVFQTKNNGNEDILVAYSLVPHTSFFILQVYKFSEAQRFLYLFAVKIFFSFLVVASLFMLLGLFFIRQLTFGLKRLETSTQEFKNGNFSHRADIFGKDEVSQLALRFNEMAATIQSNIRAEQVKARMEIEIKTAQEVQETLFLPSHYRSKQFDFYGYYEPARECSGDWWYYFETEDSLWICIGDVTGHGVAAAMLTSSVRSTFSLIPQAKNLSPSLILKTLNKVIFETVGGKLNMTFSVIEFSKTSKHIRYSNASHEFPMVLKRSSTMSKHEIVFLDGANGPRLGESSESEYLDAQLEISDETRIVCYSDGMMDVRNNQQTSFGERRFLKALLKSNQNQNSPEFIEDLMKDIRGFRAGSALNDDLSIICVDRFF